MRTFVLAIGFVSKMEISSVIDSTVRLIRDGLMSRIDSVGRQIRVVPDQKLLMASVVVILLGTLGVGTVMSWVSVSPDRAGSESPVNMLGSLFDETESNRVKCPECGVVESRREIAPINGETFDATSVRNVEVTLRMKNGTSRQFMDANASNWRLGERVIVIGSTPQQE